MLGDIVSRILDFIKELWPLRMVRYGEQGVRLRGGDHPKLLEPGWYGFLPFYEQIEILSVLPDVIDLPLQTVTTCDDFSVTISANVVFHVTDATAHWTNVQDFHENMPRMASRHLMAKVRGWTWEELRTRQPELERSLRETMNTRITRLGWGAVIEDVGITDLSRAKTYRLLQG